MPLVSEVYRQAYQDIFTSPKSELPAFIYLVDRIIYKGIKTLRLNLLLQPQAIPIIHINHVQVDRQPHPLPLLLPPSIKQLPFIPKHSRPSPQPTSFPAAHHGPRRPHRPNQDPRPRMQLRRPDLETVSRRRLPSRVSSRVRNGQFARPA